MKLLRTFLIAVSLLAGVNSHADPDRQDGSWHFTVLFPMIWAPDIKGDIRVGDDSYTVKIPFDEKIEDLETGLIGEFYVHKGNWSGGMKINYMRSVAQETTEGIKIPGGPTLVSPHRIESVTEEGTFDLVLGYYVGAGFTAYGGMRQFGQKFTLETDALEDDGLGIDEKFNLVDERYSDAIIGLSWSRMLGERWRLTLAGDGNIAGDSDRNLLLEGRVGFRISDLNNVWFGYRYSQIKLTPDVDGPEVVTDFRQHGPTLGWAFTF